MCLLAAASGGGEGGALAGLLLFLVLVALLASVYFLPTIIARVRMHPQFESILVVNFFLGWTLIGWVAALAWSVSASATARAQVVTAQLGHVKACRSCGRYVPVDAIVCPWCATPMAPKATPEHQGACPRCGLAVSTETGECLNCTPRSKDGR